MKPLVAPAESGEATARHLISTPTRIFDEAAVSAALSAALDGLSDLTEIQAAAVAVLQDAQKSGRAEIARAFAASRSRSRNAATTVAAWVLKNSGPNTTEHLGEELTTPSDLPLTAARMVVGRKASDSVSLEIAVPTVSGAHAMIEVTDAKVMVTDLSSTNGTFIDGEELQAGIAYDLEEGGEVSFDACTAPAPWHCIATVKLSESQIVQEDAPPAMLN